MIFTEKYPNLTWWFTCPYYVIHNGGNSLTLYDQGREVWDSGEITDFDETLNAAEAWIEAEYSSEYTDSNKRKAFANGLFSEKYPHLSRWFMDAQRSIHNRDKIVLNLYEAHNCVWDSGEMTDVNAIFEAADAWIRQDRNDVCFP